jgi:hypothetical protein
MKRLFIVFGLFLVACPLYASLESLESYTNFGLKKEMWVCTSIAFPVDISYDAFNVDFKTIAQNGSGYFVQVKPGTHKDGSVFPDADDIVQNHASGVLNVVGKPAGVYEYIFISAEEGFCGMGNGEQAVVRVYLVPQPTGFPVLTNVCPGKTEKVDFNQFIPPELRYFIEEMGWTITYTTLDGKEIDMPVEAGLHNIGDNVYKYTIDDSKEGPFQGKFAATQSSVYLCPEDSAHLTHTVRIRENEEYAIPDKSISFCTDVLSLVPETKEVLSANLFGYLGSSAPDGKWSIEYKGNLTESDIWVDETTGDARIPTMLITTFNIDNIIFKYSYKDCMANDMSTLLTFNFNKSTFSETFVEVQKRDVCRNLMSGVVELSSIFGFTAPLTSGIWHQQVEDGEFEEMLYGAVDISEMKSGSLYTFRYDVNSAVDAMCLVQGSSTLFQLRMHDLEVANAEARICKTQFANGVTIDLSRYVPGLNDASRIPPDRITWKDTADAIIANPSAYQLKSSADWQTADTSTYKMHYKYEVESDCGLYSGSLYISTIDSVGVDTVRKIVVCYTDDYAKHIDLYQVLGIVGASGNFELFDDPVNNAGTKIDDPVMTEPNVMDAHASFDEANESETYVFRYVPSGGGTNDTCVRDNMQITIVVTKYIENESEFK